MSTREHPGVPASVLHDTTFLRAIQRGSQVSDTNPKPLTTAVSCTDALQARPAPQALGRPTINEARKCICKCSIEHQLLCSLQEGKSCSPEIPKACMSM